MFCRQRSAEDVAVVAPHEHLPAADLPSVLAVERMEIPARQIRILRRVRKVLAAIRILHRDGAVGLEIVRAQKELRPRGEEDVPILEDHTPGGVLRLGKFRAVRPRVAVVFGKENLPVNESKGFVVALRVDVGPLRCEPIPEVLGRSHVGWRGAEFRGFGQQEAADGGRRGLQEPASIEEGWGKHRD